MTTESSKETKSKKYHSVIEDWRNKKTFDERSAESKRIKSKYPDRIPIIVIANNSNKNGEPLTLSKNKYLTPSDLTAGALMFAVRKHLNNIKSKEATFIFAGDTLLGGATLMSQCYQENKDPDGFLYLEISKEETFGNI